MSKFPMDLQTPCFSKVFFDPPKRNIPSKHLLLRRYVKCGCLGYSCIFLVPAMNQTRCASSNCESSFPPKKDKDSKQVWMKPPTSIFQFGCCLNLKECCISAPQTSSIKHPERKIQVCAILLYTSSKSKVLENLRPVCSAAKFGKKQETDEHV